MTELAAAIAAIQSASDAETTGFALVGGFAVSARTEPRFTRDVDFAVAVKDDAGAERFVAQLTERGFTVVALFEQTAVARLATARLRGREGTLVDLLFASSGIEQEVVARADMLEVLPEMQVPVASVGDLLALKLLSASDDRPLDAADIKALLAVAAPADLDVAKAAATLIEERGFARGRDLAGAVDRLSAG